MSADAWWKIIENYNLSVFPAQIILYLVIALAMGLLVFQSKKALGIALVKLALAVTFAWIGIGFFLVLGRGFMAYGASAFLFLSLAVLFAVDIFAKTITFRIPDAGWQRLTTLAGFGLVLLYPAIGFFLGNPLSRLISPGAFPCPTVAFALLAMATVLPGRNRWLMYPILTLLAIWSIPFPIFIQIPRFGVYEDSIMLAAGLYSLTMQVIYYRRSKAGLQKPNATDR